jgi:hypothetical protein
MSSSKQSRPKPKPKAKTPPPAQKKSVVSAPLAVAFDDDVLDEPLADSTGVFRVTNQIERQQRGRASDEDNTAQRFPDHSLTNMPAQSIADEGPTIDEELDDDATRLRRERLAMLAARAQGRTRR